MQNADWRHMAQVIEISRLSLHDQVAARLRTLLVEGRIAAGAKLNERELCEQMHVSRTPLREAIKLLAAEGLVDLLPNRGAVAVKLTETDVFDTFEVLAGLEAMSGELAARRITDAELAEVRALHYEMLACFTRGDLSNYYRVNAAIHAAINAAARNPVLSRHLPAHQRPRAVAALPQQPGRGQVEARGEGARGDGRSARRARRRRAARRAGRASQQQARRRRRAAAHGRDLSVRARRPILSAAMLIEPRESLLPQGARPVANEVSLALAARLARETEGEVLFDGGSRGRYATDASIYQIMPVGVLVPKTAADIAVAIDIARDLKVPVLPRGGGTSQCGQTTGAALVIDHSKHIRQVLEVDVERRTAVVEPGLVLDHLNAALKKHGLWFPVDVSTSAQATLGGMAGNNSCGSRSIAYGNMVHNVLGASAWLADGTLVDFGPVAGLAPRGREIADFVRGLAAQHHAEIADRWPKVLRRVAGYNLDIFDNQSERPYTGDGSVNLAHLLIGSEGTLACTKTLTLQLAELPKAKVLGVVNFPTFHAAMDAAQHIVKLGPTAVELVDRTMIELALSNPAFAPTMATALIGRPAAILLVEFAGADKAALLPKLRDLVALMGDLGLPGSVVEMAGDAPQKNLWEVRKAGLNIMMSLKGDGKPVSFIEDCAVPLEHLAEYTDALTEVFARHGTRGTWYAHASVGTLHVRPILDMRAGGAAQDARHRRGGGGAGAALQGRLQRRARRRPVPRRMDRMAVRPGHQRGVPRDQDAARSGRAVQPRQDRRHAEDGRRLAVPLRAARGPRAVPAHRDPAGARLVGLERRRRSGDRGSLGAGYRRRRDRRLRQGRRDVQQQRPLPQVRRRHDVPELPRHPRRAAS